MTAGATEEGLCLLAFSDEKLPGSGFEDIAGLLKTTIKEGENIHLRKAGKELKEYFDGSRKVFSVPLILTGPPFQQNVWKELLNIPYGTTRSYSEQAAALGIPEAVRAVAGANGRNRIAIIVPCHRVIGSDGRLTGYGGGIKRKEWLLDHEKRHSGQPFNITLFT